MSEVLGSWEEDDLMDLYLDIPAPTLNILAPPPPGELALARDFYRLVE